MFSGLLSTFQMNLTGAHLNNYTAEETGESGRYRAKYIVHRSSRDGANGIKYMKLTKSFSGKDYIAHAHPILEQGTSTSLSNFDIDIRSGQLESSLFSYNNIPHPAQARVPKHSNAHKQMLEVFGHGRLKKLGSCKSSRQRRSASADDNSDDFHRHYQKETLQHTADMDSVEYFQYPTVDKYHKYPLNGIFEDLYQCLELSKNNAEHSNCLMTLSKATTHRPDIIEEATNRLCAGHFKTRMQFYALMAATQLSFKAQSCMASMLTNTSMPHLHISDILLETHFIEELQLELAAAVFSMAKGHSNSTIKSAAIVALGSVSHNIRNHHPQARLDMLKHFEEQLRSSPGSSLPEDHEHHIHSHLAALSNGQECSTLYSILPWLNDERGEIRRAALHALCLFNCSAAEDLYIRALRHENASMEDKATIVRNLRSRQQHMDLKQSTLEAVWEHALAEIGSDSELEAALRRFYEENDHIPESDKNSWRGIQESGKNYRDLKKRVRRDVTPADFLKPLLDARIGLNKDFAEGFGAGFAAARTTLNLRNFLTLYLSIFDGRMEIDVDNTALARISILGQNLDVVDGLVAFQAGLTYKNLIPSDLLDNAWSVINNVAVALKSTVGNVIEAATKFLERLERKVQPLAELLTSPLAKFIEPARMFLTRVEDGLTRLSDINNFYAVADRLIDQLPQLEFVTKAYDRLKEVHDLIQGNIKRLEQLCLNVTGPVTTAIDRVADNIDRVVTGLQSSALFISNTILDKATSALDGLEELGRDVLATFSVVGTLRNSIQPVLDILDLSLTFSVHIRSAQTLPAEVQAILRSLPSILDDVQMLTESFAEKGLASLTPLATRQLLRQRFVSGLVGINNTLAVIDDSIGRAVDVAKRISSFYYMLERKATTAIEPLFQTMERVESTLRNVSAEAAMRVTQAVETALATLNGYVDKAEAAALNLLDRVSTAIDTVETRLYAFIDRVIETFLNAFARSGKVVKLNELLDSASELLQAQVSRLATFANDFIAMKIKPFIEMALDRVDGFVKSKIDKVVMSVRATLDRLQEWVMNRTSGSSFENITDISRDLIDGAGQFAGQLVDLIPASATLGDFVGLAENSVIEGVRIRDVAQRLFQVFNGSIGLTEPLRSLINDQLDRAGDFVKEKEQQVNSIISEARGSLDIMRLVQPLVQAFRSEMQSLIGTGLNGVRGIISRLRETLGTIVQRTRSALDFASELNPFKSGSLAILDDISLVRPLRATMDRYRSKLGGLVNTSLSRVEQFGEDFSTLRKSITTVLQDHVAHIDTYINFVCLPGAACATDLLRRDLLAISQRMKAIKPYVSTVTDFLLNNLPELLDSTTTLTAHIQPLRPLQQRVSQFIQTFARAEMYAKEILNNRLTAVLNTLRSIIASVRNTVQSKVVSTLSLAIGPGGLVERLRQFSSHITTSCTFVTKLSSYIPDPAALEPWVSALDLSQRVRDFVRGPVSVQFRKVSGLLLQAREVVRSIKRILPGDIVEKVAGYIRKILAIPSDLLDKVRGFVDGLQWQSRTLDPSDFTPWNELPQCSNVTCVRQLGRSTTAYKDYVRPLKYSHWQTLSRQNYIIPGLFEDWQPQGICTLNRDSDITLHTLFGTGVNEDKQPLILAMNRKTGKLKKIFIIATNLTKLETTQFGITDALDYIYLFGSYNQTSGRTVNRRSVLHSIKKSQLESVINEAGPSEIEIDNTYHPDAFGFGIYFDPSSDLLWLNDFYDEGRSGTRKQDLPRHHKQGRQGGVAIAINVLVDGRIASNAAPSRALLIGSEVQDMVVSQREGFDYVALLRCGKQVGYGCRIEFRRIPTNGTAFRFNKVVMRSVLTSDPSRAVRVPDGATGFSYTGRTEDRLMITFASGAQSQINDISLSITDVEDSSWTFTFPVMEQQLNPRRAITRNEVFLKVLNRYVVSPRPLLPFSSERNYTASRGNERRRRRASDNADLFSGCISTSGSLLRPRSAVLLQASTTFVAFVIPMKLSFFVRVSWGVDYEAGLCLAEREVRASVIPFVQAEFEGRLGVNLFLVEFGISLTAVVMRTEFRPTVTLGLTPSFALKSCLFVDINAVALELKLRAYAAFRLCFGIKCAGGWFPICWPVLEFCDPKFLDLYSFSTRPIIARVLDVCRVPPDTTAPEPGTVSAKQTSQTAIYTSWEGFSDPQARDLRYEVSAGTFAGGSNIVAIADQAAAASAALGDVALPHGQPVYVTVVSRNDEGLKTPVTSSFVADTTGPYITVRDGNESHSGDVSHQWQTNRIQAVLAVTDESPVTSTSWAIGTTPGGTDVQDYVNSGYATQLENPNVNLRHNQQYFVSVMSINSLGITSTKSTNGVLVDTTNPVPGTVADNSYVVSMDFDYVISTVNLKASWTGFSDPESPLVFYEWTVIDDTGTEQFPWRSVGLNTVAYTTGLSLQQGQHYRTFVRVWNKAGLYTNVTSNGFTVDFTFAICTPVLDIVDGQTGDVDYTATLPAVKASWSCQDAESGVVEYMAAIGSFQGGQDLQSFMPVTIGADGSATVTFTSYSVPAGQPLYVLISARNGAGLELTQYSDGIVLDETKPFIAQGYLYDTLPLAVSQFDQDYQTLKTAAAPEWKFVFLDSESPVVSYSVELLDTDGKVIVEDGYTSDITSALLSNLGLVNGDIYHVRINCTNEAGLASSTETDGFMVDTTPPRIGTVRDGQDVGDDIGYWHHATSAFGNYQLCLATNASDTWPPVGAVKTPHPSTCTNESWYDWESGLDYAETAVMTADGKVVIPWQYVSVDFDFTGRSGTLEQGNMYYFALRLHNKAGLNSESTSNGVMIDNTPAEVVDVHATVTGESSPLVISREEFLNLTVHFDVSDKESGVKDTAWSIGTYAGGSDLIPPTAPEADGQPTIKIGPLFDGQSYYVTVSTRNGANRLSTTTSSGFTIDRTPPQPGVVIDGFDVLDSKYQSWNSTVHAQWRWTGDNVALATREVGIGSSPAAADIIPFRLVALTDTQASLSDTTGLPDGVILYYLVRETDTAGFVTVSASNGITIDSTPPTCKGKVRESLQGDTDWFSQGTWFSANWDECEEPDTAIQQYYLGLADSVTEMVDNVVPFRAVGVVRKAIIYNLNLTGGVKYYSLLKAVNRAGQGTTVISNGFSVDRTPPTCTYVRDGLVGDIFWQTTAATLAVNFDCSDPESGIVKTEWAAGTFPGAGDTKSFTMLAVRSDSAEDPNIAMDEGTLYYNSIRVTNGVGMTATFTSNGMAFDSTPPIARFVNDGTSRQVDKDYTANTTHISATWGINDVQSGIRAVTLGVGTTPQSADVVDFYSVEPSATYATVPGNFLHNTKHYVLVRAENEAGLSAILSSDGVLVDMTPPMCSFVHDGVNLGTDAAYQVSTSALGVNWNCTDPESGISSIKRTSPTANQPVALRLTANNSLVSGYVLTSGQVYTVTLNVDNNAGSRSTFATNGVTVDNTPPMIDSVRFVFNETLNAITGTWSASDVGSGISGFFLTIGEQPNAGDVLQRTSIGNVMSISTVAFGSQVTLQPSKQYHITLEVQDLIGLKSAVTSRVTSDTTPPAFSGKITPSIIYPEDIMSSTEADVSVVVAWFGIGDPETDVLEIALAVVPDSVTADQYASLQYQSVSRSAAGALPSKGRVEGITVENTKQYRAVVRATNGAGLVAYFESELITASFGVFTVGVVNDGLDQDDADYQTANTAAWCNWFGFRDPTHGIKSYKWGLGTEPDQTDVLEFKDVELRLFGAQVHGLNLVNGATYYATVCATNNVGTMKCASSDGVTVDRSKPTISSISFSPASSYISSDTEVIISWIASDEESSISSSVISLGTYPHGKNLLEKTHLGNASQYTIPAALLTEELSPIYATVRVNDAAGLFTTMSSPHSLSIDNTPPRGGVVSLSREVNTYGVSWTGFRDVESGIEGYRWCLGEESGMCNIWSWTDASIATAAATSPLTLAHGSTVVASVDVRDKAGLTTMSFSEELTVDETPPVAGTVWDGLGESDIDYQVDNHYFSASWDSFGDEETGIAEYQVCVGNTKGMCNVRAFFSVGDDTAATVNMAGLVEGTTYYVTVKAVNGFGLSTRVSTDGIILDSSAPREEFVIVTEDGTSHVDHSSGSQLTAKWQFTESESGVRKYEWAVCLSNDESSCVQDYTSIGTSTNASNPALPLVSGEGYIVKIRATNNAGLQTVGTSRPVTFDSTTPLPSTIIDGSGRSDIVYQSSASIISASWTRSVDDESGIMKYDWCIGSALQLCDVLPWTVVADDSLKSTADGLQLEQGGTYFVSVRATNRAGLFTVANSDGVTVDTTIPSCSTVEDGQQQADVDYQFSEDRLSATWSACEDDDSGVAEYQWAVGTSPGLSDILAFTSVGLSTTAARTVLPIAEGRTIYSTVRAVNGAGSSKVVSTDGVVIDPSPPSTPEVFGGSRKGGKYGQYENLQSTFSAYWTSMDGTSGIVKNEWAICSLVGSEEQCIQPFTDVKLNSNATFTSSRLESGVCYYVKVRVTNGAGRTSTGTSRCTILDWTAPVSSLVDASSPQAQTVQYSTTRELAATWTGFVDLESHIKNQSWCIGTSLMTMDDVMSCTGVPVDATSASYQSPALLDGQQYFITVRAENGAGLRSSSVANIIIIDSTPPRAGMVLDGLTENDLDYSSNTASMSFNWALFSDNVSSIDHYDVAVGTAPGMSDIIDWRNVGLALQTTLPRTLTSGMRVYATVRALNRADLPTQVSSDGITLDSSRPAAGLVWLETSEGYQSSLTHIAARWSGFGDMESGIKYYAFKICALSSSTCPQDFVNVGQNTNATSSAQLTDGETYIVVVRAYNGAGLYAESTSLSSVTIDATPPDVTFVNDGLQVGSDESFQSHTNELSANWNFRDSASPIDNFEVCAHDEDNRNVTLSCRTIRNKYASSASLPVSLVAGRTYVVQVTAMNSAGESTSVFTNGVGIVSSPPTAGVVLDGDGVVDVEYQFSSSQLSASWSGFTDSDSEITEYRWSIGTSPQAGDILEATYVGVANRATTSGLCLVDKTTYFVSVTAYNAAGLTVTATSNGITVDQSPPMAGDVYDGMSGSLSTEIDYQANTASLSATWQPFTDPESGIDHYEFSLLEQPRVGNQSLWLSPVVVQNFSSVALNTSVTASPKQLVPGYRYNIVIRGYNGARLYAESRSDGFIIEESPPVIGVETWSGGDFYGTEYISSPMQIATSVLLNANTTDNSTAQATQSSANTVTYDPKTSYHLSIPSVQNENRTQNTSATATVILTGEYAARNLSVGSYEDSSSPCCSNDRVYAKVSDVDIQLTLAGTVGQISSATVSSTGYVAICTSQEALVFHADNPSKLLYRQRSAGNLEGAKWSCASSGDFLAVSSPEKAEWIQFTSPTSKPAVLQSVSVSQLPTTVRLLPNLAVTSGYMLVVAELSTGNLAPCAITSAGFSSSSCLPEISASGQLLVDAYDNVIAISSTSLQTVSVWQKEPNGNFMRDHTITVSGPVSSLKVIKVGVKTYTAVGSREAGSPNSQLSSGVLLFEVGSGDKSSRTQAACAISNTDDTLGFGDSLSWQSNGADGTLAIGGSMATAMMVVVNTSGASINCSPAGSIVLLSNTSMTTGRNAFSFGYELLVMTTTTGSLYLSAFCNVNSGRQASSNPQQLPIQCTKCPAGFKSSGGVMDNCRYCSPDSVCLTSYQTRINTVLDIPMGDGLVQAERYVLQVQATSDSGRIMSATSGIFELDLTPPLPGSVLDGSKGDDADFLNIATFDLGCTFGGFDDPESGIREYYWCVGTTPGACDFLPLAGTDNTSFASGCEACDVVDKTTYYVTVVAYNWANLSVNATSNGFLVDLTPPVMKFVNDGYNPPDQERIIFTDSAMANWHAVDNESDIHLFHLSLGTTPGGDDIASMIELGPVSKWLIPNLDLQRGTRYYVTVAATNNAGLSANMSSNGFIIGESLVEIKPEFQETTVLYYQATELSKSYGYDRSNTSEMEPLINQTESIGSISLPPLRTDVPIQVASKQLHPSDFESSTPPGRKRRAVSGYANPATTAPQVNN